MSEATQLNEVIRAQWLQCVSSGAISWVASRSLAMTAEVARYFSFVDRIIKPGI